MKKGLSFPVIASGSVLTEITDAVDFAKGDGLIAALAIDAATNAPLMLAYMNEAAWRQTLETEVATYYSRSRGELWVKGQQSGNQQRVQSIALDCDGDALVLRVTQKGGACHCGYRSCFYRMLTPEGWRVMMEKLFDPAEVYSEK